MPLFQALQKRLHQLRKKTDRFSDLILDQKWVRLISLIDSPNYQTYLKNACGPFHFHYFNYLSMIHQVCMMKAPPYVIVSLVNAFPSCVIMPDKKRRLPLHIACKYGADPEVLAFLVGKNPAAANRQDINGRTPLHMACECKSRKIDEMQESFKILIRASPSSLMLTDSKGLTVLDYANIRNLEIYLIQLIEWEMRKLTTLPDLSVIEEESYCSDNSIYSTIR